MPSRFRTYNLNNIDAIHQLQSLPEQVRRAIPVVGRVFPFRTNNYVVNELIDWTHAEEDPLFRLNFPCREMLLPHHYAMIQNQLSNGSSKAELVQTIQAIRRGLNP